MAALQGRVETLFLGAAQELWGAIVAEGREVELHEKCRPGDVGVLERTAAEVLRHRGTVYVLEEESMPARSAVAGILRY